MLRFLLREKDMQTLLYYKFKTVAITVYFLKSNVYKIKAFMQVE